MTLSATGNAEADVQPVERRGQTLLSLTGYRAVPTRTCLVQVGVSGFEASSAVGSRSPPTGDGPCQLYHRTVSPPPQPGAKIPGLLRGRARVGRFPYGTPEGKITAQNQYL